MRDKQGSYKHMEMKMIFFFNKLRKFFFYDFIQNLNNKA